VLGRVLGGVPLEGHRDDVAGTVVRTLPRLDLELADLPAGDVAHLLLNAVQEQAARLLHGQGSDPRQLGGVDPEVEPLAAAEAVLAPAERDLGVVVADLGGGTTSIGIFVNGGLCHVGILPVAGAHLTSDIAVGMRTPMAEAEKLKVRWGAATPAIVTEGEMIEVFGAGAREPRVIPRRVLAEYIEPRLDEIFAMVRGEIRRSGYMHRIPAGIVLTGGGAQLEGLDAYAESRLALPSRIGTPSEIGGLVEAVRGPAFSTGVGLALYGSRGRQQVGVAHGNGARTFWDKTRTWLRGVLESG